jgi:hypothetical protein
VSSRRYAVAIIFKPAIFSGNYQAKRVATLVCELYGP